MFTQEVQAKAFNEWMRRYTEEPEAFEHEVTTIKGFLASQAGGEEPTYGQTSAAYLAQLCKLYTEKAGA